MNATITRSDDEDGPATLTVTFEPPLPYKGGVIETFVLREPKARQVREAEKVRTFDAPFAGVVAYELKLIALVSGLPDKATEVLPVMVANHCSTFLQEFVEAGSPAEGEEDEQDEGAPEPSMLDIVPPITFMGVAYSDLDIREPLASEVRNARALLRNSGNLFESRRAQMSLVAVVAALPPPVVDELRISTLNEAARRIGRFIKAGRKTTRH